MLFCRLSSNCPLIAYFLKKNYSLRQNILKNLRVWERSLISVPIGVYLDLIHVGTWLGTGSAKGHWRFAGKEWPDAASDSDVQRPVSSQEVNLLRRSDQTLLFYVWSEDVSASGRVKKTKAKLTGLWLHPVGVHWTRPVALPEELDLSGIDRTLGGSVRSLPPERPVSGSRAASGLLFRFLSYRVGGPI